MLVLVLDYLHHQDFLVVAILVVYFLFHQIDHWIHRHQNHLDFLLKLQQVENH
jgi:hypothetical protein